jgi:hypothetical protein
MFPPTRRCSLPDDQRISSSGSICPPEHARATYHPLSSDTREAPIPLYRIWDAIAVTRSSLLPPSFSPPVFPTRAVISFAPAPFLGGWRWRRSRADLNRKSGRRLYLNLGMGWLHVHGAGE